MNKRYESIHRYDFLTKELLEEEYVKNGLTDGQIADKYSMPSKTVIWRKRKKFGIENRTPTKSNKNASKNRKYNIELSEAEMFISKGMTYEEIAEKVGCSIIVVKRRFKELGLSKEQSHTDAFKYYDIDLDSREKQVITGSLLGDGGITDSNAYGCTHSDKQSEYFFHKMGRLDRIHSGAFQHTIGTDPYGNICFGLRFTTGTNKFIENIKSIFYPIDRKVFPLEYLMSNLDTEGLAYWYMDDGSFSDGNQSRFHIEGLYYEDALLCQRLFIEKFNMDARLIEKKRKEFTYKQHYLSLTVDSSRHLIDMIRPFIHPSMMYKIGE